MRLRNALLIAGALVTAAAIFPAVADITYTQGSGTTIFDFTCFTTKHCSAHTPINSAGTEIFTSSAPGQVTGANGTFPATQSGTWTVQPGNTANTTAWLVTGTGGTFPATQSGTWNINNISGTISLPTGAATAANQATANSSLATIATNSGNPVPVNVNTVATALTGLTPGVAQTGTVVAANTDLTSVGGVAIGAMANYGTSPGAVKVQGVNAFITNTPTVALNTTPSLANGNGTVPTQGGAVLSATNGSYTNVLQGNAVLSATNPTFTRLTDGTNGQVLDPCQTVAKNYTPINISASGSARIITGTSAKKTYICQINLVTNAANNVALTEGTGTNCGTGTAGVIGGTTAASGWNFSANGGISIGMGGFAAIGTATNADDVCLNPSAATQLSGQVVWVQQ